MNVYDMIHAVCLW